MGKIRKRDRIFLTQLIIRIENTEDEYDMISNRFGVSFPIGASNNGFK